MINTYSYLETSHSKLHEFVMAFFARIEFETNAFNDNYFEKEFFDNVLSHHPGILKEPLIALYEKIKDWDQNRKTEIVNALKDSNKIKEICEGKVKPWKVDDIPNEIRQELYDIFKTLYDKVLKGKIFTGVYGKRLDHYHEFKKYKKNGFEYCPACGIVEMKNCEETIANQYDHYLPKTIYPFSSVNFENLVPTCTDCNSFLIKSDADVLNYTGVLFYPFDDSHRGIDIKLEIKKDNLDEMSKIVWQFFYTNPDKKTNEVLAWRNIYDIDNRHSKHIAGNLKNWFGFYLDYMNDEESKDNQPNYTERKKDYLRSIKNRKTLEYSALSVFLDSNSVKSDKEAKKYSRYS